MKVFEFDAGNTRLKWRVLDSGQEYQSGILINGAGWSEVLPALLKQLEPIDHVRGGIVSGKERKATISHVVSKVLNLQVEFAAVNDGWKGLKLAYPDESKLGVDRWLAMLAVHQQYPDRNFMAIDCGTALTVDLVRSGGVHLGGYLVPGVQLMQQVLLSGTADIKQLDMDVLSTFEPGTNTRACIGHGILAMMTGMVEKGLSCLGDNPLIVLTGGDGGLLKSYLSAKVDVIERPSLVMDGLVFAF